MSGLKHRNKTSTDASSADAAINVPDGNKIETADIKKLSDQGLDSLPNPLVLQYLVIIRIINAFTINTFFQPDEYFQALEPAHKLYYGYGNTTWEWARQLRSFNYPFLFYVTYWVNDQLGMGDIGVNLGPKVVQATISAISEYYLYKLSQKLLNEKLARAVLLLSVASSFNWFCFTRTFSNTIGLNFTIISLNYWPWLKFSKRLFAVAVFFAASAVIIRPETAITFVVLGLWLLARVTQADLWAAVAVGAAGVGAVLALNTGIDYFYYGELVFPIINFINFNLRDSISDFYGINSWHFHVSQSLPFLLTTYLPLFIWGLTVTPKNCPRFPRKLFLTIIVANIGLLSFVTHKEFRFVYQLMPVLLVFTSFGFLNLYYSRYSKIIYVIVVVNLGLNIFLTQFQELGVIGVIDFLKFNPDVDSVGFLTPCHSTPLQSHLHRNDLDIWTLTCEPPADSHLAQYKDESDKFYENPKLYLDINFPPFDKRFRNRKQYPYEWPTHLVFFESLEPFMKSYLARSKYQECDRFFNSYGHWDSRRQGDVIIYCKWPWE